MEEVANEHAGLAPPTPRATDKAELAARLGVSGDFARVPQLAKALGISANSIYAQMRLGTFPMPHRRVGNVVVVKLDDYVSWFSNESASPPKPTPRPLGAPTAPPPESTPASGIAGKETPKQKGERWKREVREELRRKGLA